MLKQMKAALRAKSNAKASRYIARLEYQAALKELCSLKERWRCGRISHRTYQIYKAETTELRKELERDLVGYKKEVHLAHDRHYQLLAL